EHFGMAALGRIAAPNDAHQIAREAFGDAPDRVVDGTRHGRVEVVIDFGIERGIQPGAATRARIRATGCGIALIEDGLAATGDTVPWPRDPSVAVGVDHLATPAHRFLFVLRLVKDLCVDPAEDGTG